MSTTPDLSRPRSRRIHAEVLAATAALLGQGGLAAATTEAIVSRSGVSKATVYNHWPNRLTLAIEAFTELMAGEVAPPESGDTRAELTRHIELVCDFYSRPQGRVYAELLAAGVTDPAAARQLQQGFLDRRREIVLATWQRGVTRGDIDPALDFQAVNDVLFGPVIFRLVSGHAPLDAAAARTLSEVALAGVLRPGAPDEPTPADQP